MKSLTLSSLLAMELAVLLLLITLSRLRNSLYFTVNAFTISLMKKSKKSSYSILLTTPTKCSVPMKLSLKT